MKAMILAAGIGLRLKPLTNKTPKALIKVSGTPMIEVVIRRLMAAGVREIIINTHYKADMIRAFLKAKKNFGIRIETSYEPELLDTGGGLKKAAYFFDNGQPFILHNVDVFTNIDLKRMREWHAKRPTLATLAVSKRPSERYLVFNKKGLLQGRDSSDTKGERLAFNGIHIISGKIFSFMRQDGPFSIIDTYLETLRHKEKIQAFRSDSFIFQDIGTPAKLTLARRLAQKH